jgi:hypothetical protein
MIEKKLRPYKLLPPRESNPFLLATRDLAHSVEEGNYRNPQRLLM